MLPEITLKIYFPKSRRRYECIVRISDTQRFSPKFWESEVFEGKYDELVRILQGIGKK